jgi:IS30 family transposase
MLKAYKHLTYEQRCQIYALKQQKFTQSTISVSVGVSQSTISREFSRNTGKRGYRFNQANDFAKERSIAQKSVKRVMTPTLIEKIDDAIIAEQWSPEQISGRFALESGEKVSHESIYQHIWRDKKSGGKLFKNLRQRGKKRNKRSGKNAGRGCIPNRIDIAQRPQIVEQKERLGDWELDSIIGAKHVGAITSMVDRVSKLTRLALLKGPTAEATCEAIIKCLKPLKEFVFTMTSDNGKEFAWHAKISEALGSLFYFCTPYHSWERGLNENTNGLVRQYFPKGLDFAGINEADVQKVEDLLNNRPRKTLNYQTPNEVFAKLTAKILNYALLT